MNQSTARSTSQCSSTCRLRAHIQCRALTASWLPGYRRGPLRSPTHTLPNLPALHQYPLQQKHHTMTPPPGFQSRKLRATACSSGPIGPIHTTLNLPAVKSSSNAAAAPRRSAYGFQSRMLRAAACSCGSPAAHTSPGHPDRTSAAPGVGCHTSGRPLQSVILPPAPWEGQGSSTAGTFITCVQHPVKGHRAGGRAVAVREGITTAPVLPFCKQLCARLIPAYVARRTLRSCPPTMAQDTAHVPRTPWL